MPCAYGFESLRPHHKKRGHKGGLFFCEVRSTLSVAQSIHPTAQRVPPVATAKRGNAYQFENSVPERGFSCTESTRGTVEGLLRYATYFQRHSVHENPLFLHGRRFQRNSVLKIGFYGTEGISGTKNTLLWYGRDIQCGAGGRKTTPGKNNHRRKTTTRAQEGRPQYIAADYNRVNA